MRRLFRNRRAAVALGSAVVLLLALIAIVIQWFGGGPPRIEHKWYFDLNTKTLFKGPIDALPPIDAPSGPLPSGKQAGVEAYVFTCGACVESEWYVGWLQTLTDEVKNNPAPTNAEFFAGLSIGTPDGEQWVPANSPQANALYNDARGRCGPKQRARQCVPR